MKSTNIPNFNNLGIFHRKRVIVFRTINLIRILIERVHSILVKWKTQRNLRMLMIIFLQSENLFNLWRTFLSNIKDIYCGFVIKVISIIRRSLNWTWIQIYRSWTNISQIYLVQIIFHISFQNISFLTVSKILWLHGLLKSNWIHPLIDKLRIIKSLNSLINYFLILRIWQKWPLL